MQEFALSHSCILMCSKITMSIYLSALLFIVCAWMHVCFSNVTQQKNAAGRKLKLQIFVVDVFHKRESMNT